MSGFTKLNYQLPAILGFLAVFAATGPAVLAQTAPQKSLEGTLLCRTTDAAEKVTANWFPVRRPSSVVLSHSPCELATGRFGSSAIRMYSRSPVQTSPRR